MKLDHLHDIDILLMVEKGVREGICHSIYQYAKANNKYMKDFDKNKESSYIRYWYVNGWAMLQKLPVNNFERVKDTSQFNEDVIKKTIMKEVMFNILKNDMNFIMIYHFTWKNEDWKGRETFS